VVACLLIVSFPSIQLYLQADYTSSIGEARRLQLEDGSIVHLGADSALDVAYETQARRVRLLYGEAFFEVKPDRHRPFLVTAGQLETVVIGTTFNVHLTPGGASVAVHDGVVKVASPAFSPPFEDHLRAGDWVRMSWDKASVERGTTPPQQVAAWRQGQLVVKDWPISEVVATLRRYHHGLIVLTDDNLGQSKVTGVYNLHDPLGSLRAVASPYAAVVREITPYLVFLSAS
jgi:transmembrane sensor